MKQGSMIVAMSLASAGVRAETDGTGLFVASIVGLILFLIGTVADIVSTQQAVKAGLKEANDAVYGKDAPLAKMVVAGVLSLVLLVAMAIAAYWDMGGFLPVWFPIALGGVFFVIRGYGAYRNFQLIRNIK